jgi:hypothetical protein
MNPTDAAAPGGLSRRFDFHLGQRFTPSTDIKRNPALGP